jgi:hypothetical protein
MKKLLFLFPALLPFLATGQKYELNINGGINYNTAPAYISYDGFNGLAENGKTAKLKAGYAFSASISKNLRSKDGDSLHAISIWQLGLKVDILQMIVREFADFGDMSMKPEPWYTWQTIHLGEPAIAPSLFLNRKINVRKNIAYVGISMGAIYTTYKIMPKKATGYMTDWYFPDYGLGYTIGLQVGYKYKLSRSFSLSAELSPRYNNVYYSTKTSDNWWQIKSFSNVSFPIMIGLAYSFGQYHTRNN